MSVPWPRPASVRVPAAPRLRATRVVVVVCIALITSFFGLANLAAVLAIPGILAPADFATGLLVSSLGFLLLWGDVRLRRVLRRGGAGRPVLVILGLVALVTLSMPVRGDVDVLEAVRIARWFFPLLIFFLVARDVRVVGDARGYERLVFALALVYTFGTLLYSFAPELGRAVFRGAALETSSDSWGMGVERHVLKGNSGILFMHLGFILAAQRLVQRGVSHGYLGLVVACGAGVMLQGWRAVMLGAFFGLIATSLRIGRSRFRRAAGLGLMLLVLAAFVDAFLVRGIVRAKVVSALLSLYTGEGAIGARWARDEVYMIPMFLERPWFGWGFIHKSSGLAGDIGMMDSQINKAYTLYNFDSGVLTLLNMFGIVGVAVFAAALATLLYRCRVGVKEVAKTAPAAAAALDHWSASALAFGLMLAVSQHTFGGLMTPIGLLPLAIVTGVCHGLRTNAGVGPPSARTPLRGAMPRRRLEATA